MIPRTHQRISHDTDTPARGNWRLSFADAVRDLDELKRLLELEDVDLGSRADRDFPLLVPRSFIARMRKGDPRDPLLLQVLPTRREQEDVADFTADPLDELRVSASGVVEKYAGRSLLVTTAACPVHCRYCFRREYPYARQNAAQEHWRPALHRLRARDDVSEVILSGGDPLSLATHKLAELFVELEAIDQVQTLRIHTRYPVMIPERIDDELIWLLASTPLRVVVVVHVNHMNEINDAVTDAFRRLKRCSSQLLNQSVLLRGVNDEAQALTQLSERLFASDVLPYYLHLLDPVTGTAHFDVPLETALELINELRRRLPGYLVPRLVREVPGELSKTWMG